MKMIITIHEDAEGDWMQNENGEYENPVNSNHEDKYANEQGVDEEQNIEEIEMDGYNEGSYNDNIHNSSAMSHEDEVINKNDNEVFQALEEIVYGDKNAELSQNDIFIENCEGGDNE